MGFSGFQAKTDVVVLQDKAGLQELTQLFLLECKFSTATPLEWQDAWDQLKLLMTRFANIPRWTTPHRYGAWAMGPIWEVLEWDLQTTRSYSSEAGL